MTDYKSQYSNSGSVTLAPKGSAGDTYTFTVPNASTDSIVSAWAVRATNTGSQGLQPAGLPAIMGPTSLGTGPDGEITSVNFENQTASAATVWDSIHVIYVTPRP